MTAHPKNPRVWGWFATGRSTEALVGRAEYFLADNDYQEHDRILVLNQLVDWADDGHAAEAGAAVREAITSQIAASEFADAIKILLAYAIVARDRERHLVPIAWVRRVADQAEEGQAVVTGQLRKAIADLGAVA